MKRSNVLSQSAFSGSLRCIAGESLGMRTIRAAAAVGLLIALAGCVTSEQQNAAYQTQTAPSGALRQAALTYARTTFFDPYSVRDAQISSLLKIPATNRSGVCIRLNAKNRFGAYIGLQSTSLVFQGDRIVNSLAGDPACLDARLRYYPFPELENL